MIAEAEGKVLEVAGGTGKNFTHYTDKCSELLFVDSSEMMLQTAIWKFKVLNKENNISLKANTRVAFKVMDAEALKLPDNYFDTVIDTYGLCSFDDPVKALHEMERVCKADGKILLLEHGRSEFHQWINKYILDKYESEHAWKYGCSWNRDIPQIVADAGLSVVSQKRAHLGTNIYIVAKPKQETIKEE